jgi:hypothetical protein
MSSCPLSPEEVTKDKLDKEIAETRIKGIKEELRNEFLKCLLPRLLLQEDFYGLVDIAYGVDRRKVIVESLREIADLIENNFTLEAIKGGYVD